MRKTKKVLSLSRTHIPADFSLEQWQTALRREFGKIQNFKLKNIGQHPVFSEFIVTNPFTKRSYRVAIRGEKLGCNFCSCPDFSVNTLGTCKHIEFTLERFRRKANTKKILKEGFSLPFSEVFLRYGPRRQVVFLAGAEASTAMKDLAGLYFDKNNVLREDAFHRFNSFLEGAKHLNHVVRCYDDVLAFIAEVQDAHYRRRYLREKFPQGIDSPYFEHLLRTGLYPYQRKGVLFAVEAGRVLIADDMGIGKTPQAIAAAEILAREFAIQKVLIICPTTLKYQWKSEIEKFCGRSVCVIEGAFHSRGQLYAKDAFFRIVNYDVVRRDLKLIVDLAPDLVILDEAQRIKNWKTRTAWSIKQIKSTYAIVLTGTPLENRLEELHSILEFVDRYRLGPLFRFLANHQVSDMKSGKVIGYRNLKAIGETLSPILIRRTKKEVLSQLPERMDKNFFVPMTPEQMAIHEENREIVARIASKWMRYKFISEADQRRLMIALQYMRMACDNTYLVDQVTRFGRKLEELATSLEEIFEEDNTKVVVFSQWERMTSLVAEVLRRKKWGFAYLHGGIPGRNRKDLIHAFHEDPACRVFLSTDAGGLGLNLQPASTVINMDLPWNPAVLEQRVGRVHRLGQHKPVKVINFISERSIEQNILSVLNFKKSLFAGVLDNGQDSIFIGKSRLSKFMESVEELTGKSLKPDNEPSLIESKRGSKEALVPGDSSGGTPEPLRELFIKGADLLQNLAKSFSAGQTSGGMDLTKLLETDKETQKTCLKIPLPDKQVIESILPAMNSFVEVLRRLAER